MKEQNQRKTFDLTSVLIKTDRLNLVPISMEYRQQMLDELTEEITRYMSFYPPKSLADEEEYVKTSLAKMASGEEIDLSIIAQTSNEYLGNVSLVRLDTNTPEVGIWVKKDAHGKRIGREAINGIIKWAGANFDIDHFVYPVAKTNVPSRKTAEAFGGILAGEKVKTFPSGKRLNEVIYHIPKTSA